MCGPPNNFKIYIGPLIKKVAHPCSRYLKNVHLYSDIKQDQLEDFILKLNRNIFEKRLNTDNPIRNCLNKWHNLGNLGTED